MAIEPFATLQEEGVFKAKGRYSRVKDVPNSGSIYMLTSPRKAKSRHARALHDVIKARWPHLPFCERWIWAVLGDEQKDIDTSNANDAIDELVKRRILYRFNVLKEHHGNLVSQREHTFLIRSDDVVITTK